MTTPRVASSPEPCTAAAVSSAAAQVVDVTAEGLAYLQGNRGLMSPRLHSYRRPTAMLLTYQARMRLSACTAASAQTCSGAASTDHMKTMKLRSHLFSDL